MSTQLISYLQDTGFDLYIMREWLSGGAPPCQGGGRGFDPRLALEKRTIPNWYRSFFRAQSWARKFDVSAPLRSAQAEVPRTSCAVSRSHEKKNDTKSVSFFFLSPARARKFDVYAPLRSALLSNKFCVSQYLCLIVQWVT